ncbi:MAG: methyltransferase family protein [Deltaproteobacteria bacterium]
MLNLKDDRERRRTLLTFTVGGSFIMGLWVGLPYAIHRFVDPDIGVFAPGPWRWVGGACVAAGYALAVWCVMLFIHVGEGTPLPFAGPRRLVIAGPYRVVRNPMVLGTVLFLLGDGLAMGSRGILYYACLVFFVMHLFVLLEERSLERRFGAAYHAYRRQTPRWWPKMPLRHGTLRD